MASGAKKTILTIVLTVAAIALIGLAAVVFVAYSGLVDVAATNRPSALTSWVLRTTRAHSVAVRAKTIDVPSLDVPRMLEVGAEHYQEMCVGCHGAPGVEAGEAAQGLEPPPPQLYRGPPMSRRRAAQTFWVVKNGIQMTGMPAFGKRHSDQAIWAIVGFVSHLHDMSPAEYRKATAKTAHVESDETPVAADHAGHDHAAQDHDQRAGGHTQRHRPDLYHRNVHGTRER